MCVFSLNTISKLFCGRARQRGINDTQLNISLAVYLLCYGLGFGKEATMISSRVLVDDVLIDPCIHLFTLPRRRLSIYSVSALHEV